MRWLGLESLLRLPTLILKLALHQGIDGLVAGGDPVLERSEGGVPAHLEVAPPLLPVSQVLKCIWTLETLGKREAGGLVEREAAGEVDLRRRRLPGATRRRERRKRDGPEMSPRHWKRPEKEAEPRIPGGFQNPDTSIGGQSPDDDRVLYG
ncbi:unnamed protein product [Urochloa humidicola]